MEAENFIKKIENIKGKNSLDISAWEDLSIALMNIISLEEHSYFSYLKTKDDKFLQILSIARELRKKLLPLIVEKDDSEKWCMSKHLLASSMRLYEVGNRLLNEDKDKAKEMYHEAAELYGLFWSLNKDNAKEITLEAKEKKSLFSSIKKFLECCKE